MKKLMLLITMAGLLVAGMTAFAQDGQDPSVAVTSNGTVIEAHQGTYNGLLWYNLGYITYDASGNPTVNWVKNAQTGSTGRSIKVAANDNYVVEVHECFGSADDVWMTIGTINYDSNNLPSSITWGETLEISNYLTAYSGSLAISLTPENSVNIVSHGGYSVNYLVSGNISNGKFVNVQTSNHGGTSLVEASGVDCSGNIAYDGYPNANAYLQLGNNTQITTQDQVHDGSLSGGGDCPISVLETHGNCYHYSIISGDSMIATEQDIVQANGNTVTGDSKDAGIAIAPPSTQTTPSSYPGRLYVVEVHNSNHAWGLWDTVGFVSPDHTSITWGNTHNI